MQCVLRYWPAAATLTQVQGPTQVLIWEPFSARPSEESVMVLVVPTSEQLSAWLVVPSLAAPLVQPRTNVMLKRCTIVISRSWSARRNRTLVANHLISAISTTITMAVVSTPPTVATTASTTSTVATTRATTAPSSPPSSCQVHRA